MHDLSQIAVFEAVVGAQSFSRAADDLNISKALVSRRIAELEASLGCKLLKRTTRRLSLTAAGAVYHERAAQVLEYVDAARREVESLDLTGASGMIRVAGGAAFSPRHLVPAIARFMALHPSIRVVLSAHERHANLVSDDIDVSVRTAEVASLSSLVACRLAPFRRVLCASPEYLRSHRPPRRPDELSEYNCLMAESEARGDLVLRSAAGVERVRLAGTFSTNNSEVLTQATLNGLGVGFVPTFIAGEYIRSGRLVRVLPEFEGAASVLYAAHLPDRNLPHRVRLFVRFLQQHFGAVPYWDAQLTFVDGHDGSEVGS